MALKSVECAGLIQAAYRYSASSFFVWFYQNIPFAIGFVLEVDLLVFLLFLLPNGISHKTLLLRLPSIITMLFFIILRLYLETRETQLLSHNFPMDTKDPVDKSLYM